jgi:hypothetical protein
MPTSIAIPASAQQLLLAEAKFRAENLSKQIAFGSLMAWALAMLLIGAVARFGADAATLATFDLIASF